MDTRFTTKQDLAGRIVGLEQYVPGDPSTKDLALKVSSGTGGTGPTIVVEKSPVAGKKKHYLDRVRALIRLGGQPTSALAGVNLLLRHADIARTTAIDMKDLRHPSIASALAGFAATELYTIPLSFLRMVMHVLRTDTKDWAFRRVRYIFLSGEWTSEREKKEVMGKQFPKLEEYIDDYGSAEAGSYAHSCASLTSRYTDEGLLVFHPVPAVALWLKDPDEDGVGEVIISTNELTNYRSGDAGKIIEEPCSCGAQQTLVLYGRIGGDYVNCAGATFSIREVEKVFDALTDMVADYQIRVSEHDDGVSLRGQVHIMFVPSASYAHDKTASEYVAQFVSRHLGVTPTRTLADVVREGIFFPITAGAVKAIPRKDKRVRICKVV